MKRLIRVFVFVIITLAGFWVVAVPEKLVGDLIEDALKDGDLSVRLDGYRKGFFYRFHVDEIRILKTEEDKERAEKTLLLLRDVTGRISPSSFLTFRPALAFGGEAGGGSVSGTMGLTGKRRIAVKAEGVHLSELPLADSYGVTGSGLFSGEFYYEGSSGDLRFSLMDARLRGAAPVLSLVPLDRFFEVRGAAVISDGSVDIRSVSLTGKGISARLKGKAAGNRLDLTMELMTDSSFAPDPVFQSLIERYRVSPGYYRIPVKTS